MPHQFKESSFAKTALLLACLVLSSCSLKSTNSPEDSKRCLQPITLKPLKSTSGVSLPKEKEEYQLPQLQVATGPIGPAVDIYPPAQLLAFPSGSKAYFDDGEAILKFGSGEKSGELWEKIKKWLASQQIALAEADDRKQLLTTNWVDLSGQKKRVSHAARYQFSLSQEPDGVLFKSKIISLRQGKIDLPLLASDSRRYNAQMLNLVAAALAEGSQGQELDSSPTPNKAKPNGAK